MPLCTLLAPPTPENLPAWQWDHAAAHRELLGGMSHPVERFGPLRIGALSRFSAWPYFVDPQRNTGDWHFDHGQAHQDAVTTLPGRRGFAVTSRINPLQNLTDMNFDDPGLLTWWTWANSQQHMSAQSALPAILTYPFW